MSYPRGEVSIIMIERAAKKKGGKGGKGGG